ncbi:hypothetical protein SUGI_0346560 [Cryptomeria japonica]|nr:hypothetical protein SUGI_0346560 [Cryptomeria japonica]
MGKIDLMNFPDDLFCSQILTRIPLKEAVRFSAVSRKWWRAWTQLPHLKFSYEFCYSICFNPPKSKALTKFPHQNMVVDIINKIIRMQCVGVETFELYNCEMFESSIHKWLLWISLCGVKCIDLNGRGTMVTSKSKMEVSEYLFMCDPYVSVSQTFQGDKGASTISGFLSTCNMLSSIR